jgi:molybdopterin converting factor subunit 1
MVVRAETSIMSNRVKVLFFASLKAKAGRTDTTLDLEDGASVYDLKHAVATIFPEIREEIFCALVAVNREYSGDEGKIPDRAEIAIFPPVSGGNGIFNKPTFCRIQNEGIVIDEWLAKITTPTSGAIGMFVGVVRSITPGSEVHQTNYITYEAYTPMAEMKMLQIASEIRERWPSIDGIAIIQRCGELKAGSQSVLIACCATHRGDGVFDAAHYGIDRLKEIVPVWKRETGPEGHAWIDGEYKPKPGE